MKASQVRATRPVTEACVDHSYLDRRGPLGVVRPMQFGTNKLLVATLLLLALTGCTAESKSPLAEASEPMQSATVEPPIAGATPSSTTPTPQPQSSGNTEGKPGQGNVNRALPSIAQATRAPVSGTSTASFGAGVSVRLVRSEPTAVKAQGIGETSGPGMIYTLRLTNRSEDAVDLTYATVSASGRGGTPIPAYLGKPTEPFAGSVKAGKRAIGTYVFMVAADQRRSVRLTIAYSPAADAVVIAPGA